MNLRSEWRDTVNEFSDRFYSIEETVANVIENFDLRRFHSGEGYDLTINGVKERCLVQTSSNPLRELNDYRKIHCPLTADVRRGYYVQYENATWIIDTNVVNVDGAYWTARMTRCQYVLRWQNDKGKIIERWAYSSDQTKYSNGETGNGTIKVGDNQYGLLIPIDTETKLLKRGMRFVFDFDDAEIPDVYRLSNRKVNLAEGTIQLSFSFDAFSNNTDKRVVIANGLEVWICNYRSPTPQQQPTPNQVTDLFASISGNRNLKVGYVRTYTVTFRDIDGNEVLSDSVNFKWKVQDAFVDNTTMSVDYTNKTRCKLKVDNEELVDSSFLLSVIVDDKVISSVTVNIVGGF